MSFHLTLRRRFPGAISQREYVSLATASLRQAGMVAENTLVAVSHCRDEITGSVRTSLEASWGPVFELSGLAGMLSAGTSGVAAAMSHAPRAGAGSNFVLFAFAHVGIDDDGAIGLVRRRGLERPVPTCGSLQRVIDTRAIRRGDRIDSLDLEQANVERRIGKLLGPADQLDLAHLAKLALQCIEQDIDSIFQRLDRDRSTRAADLDGGLFTGVQIHGSQDRTFIWPSLARIDAGGSVVDALPAGLRQVLNQERQDDEHERPTGDRSGPRPAHDDPGRYRLEHHDHGRYQPDHHDHEHYQPDHRDHGHYRPSHREHQRYRPGRRRRRNP